MRCEHVDFESEMRCIEEVDEVDEPHTHFYTIEQKRLYEHVGALWRAQRDTIRFYEQEARDAR